MMDLPTVAVSVIVALLLGVALRRLQRAAPLWKDKQGERQVTLQTLVVDGRRVGYPRHATLTRSRTASRAAKTHSSAASTDDMFSISPSNSLGSRSYKSSHRSSHRLTAASLAKWEEISQASGQPGDIEWSTEDGTVAPASPVMMPVAEPAAAAAEPPLPLELPLKAHPFTLRRSVRRALWAELGEERRRWRRQVHKLQTRAKRRHAASQSSVCSSSTVMSTTRAYSLSSASLSFAESTDTTGAPAGAKIDCGELGGTWCEIGTGKFGSVHRCTYGPGGEEVAVKRLRSSASCVQRAAFVNEINSLLELRGRCNILHALGWSLSPEGDYLLVTELCIGGCLQDRLVSGPTLGLDGHGSVLLCVATALAYLHSNNMVHGDVSARNVLLCGNGRAKLADIGLAASRGERMPWVAVPWASPESLQHHAVATSPSDVWSFGVLVWEMLHVPYEEPYAWVRGGGLAGEDRVLLVSRMIREGTALPQPEGLRGTLAVLWGDVAVRCLQMNPAQRPAFTAVIEMLRGMFGNIFNATVVSPIRTDDVVDATYFGDAGD